jgi:hypothetical protein
MALEIASPSLILEVLASTVVLARLQNASRLIRRMHAKAYWSFSQFNFGSWSNNFPKTQKSHSKETNKSSPSLAVRNLSSSDFLGAHPEERRSSSPEAAFGWSPVAMKKSGLSDER